MPTPLISELNTPLYQEDPDGNLCKLCPETTAVQVKTADGSNVQAKLDALSDCGGCTCVLITTPVLTLEPRLPIGSPATLGMSAQAGLQGARVTHFMVSVNGAKPVRVEAVDSAAMYTFTPQGAEGDSVTVNVTAVDTFGNKSKAATGNAVLYEKGELIVAGGQAGAIRRSMNSGATWSDIQKITEIYTGFPSSVISHDKKIILGLNNAQNGCLLTSPDNGVTWQASQNLGLASIQALTAISSEIIIAGGNGFRRSLDNGLTWQPAQASGIGVVYQLAAVSDDVVIAGGVNGVCRSTDRGATWNQAQNLGIGTVFVLHATPGGVVLAGGSNGSIRRSLDMGVTWQDSQALDIGLLYSATSSPDGTIIMGSNNSSTSGSIRRSTDQGTTWTPAQDLGIGAIFVLHTTSEGIVLATGSISYADGVVCRSLDNGITWQPPQELGIRDIRTMISMTL